MKIFSLLSVLAFAALAACGDDGASGGGGTGATGGGGAGASGGGGAGGGGAGGGEPTPCGDELICGAGSACVEQQIPPKCYNKADETDPCAKGQTATYCGGDGTPCCCEPIVPEYYCADAANCDGTVSCECLGDICNGPLECENTATPGKVVCLEPAMP